MAIKMANKLNSEIVKKYGLDAGASLVGIASPDSFFLAPEGFKPTDVLDGCRSVIVFGAPFPKEAILDPSVEYIDIRTATNEKMNVISKNVAKRIKSDGYKTKAIGGMSGKWVEGMQHGHISLKHAAEIAGLGIIGRNYLLINDKYGTLLWFSAVLTDAELIPDEKAKYSVCDNCDKCVKTCPSKALDTPDLFEKKACANLMFKMEDKKWKIKCFLCRKICPYHFGIPI